MQATADCEHCRHPCNNNFHKHPLHKHRLAPRPDGLRWHASATRLPLRRPAFIWKPEKCFVRAKSLEHFQKCYSHSEEAPEAAVFLGFGFVSAQSQGFSNLLLRRSPKILAPNWLQHFFKCSSITKADMWKPAIGRALSFKSVVIFSSL